MGCSSSSTRYLITAVGELAIVVSGGTLAAPVQSTPLAGPADTVRPTDWCTYYTYLTHLQQPTNLSCTTAILYVAVQQYRKVVVIIHPPTTHEATMCLQQYSISAVPGRVVHLSTWFLYWYVVPEKKSKKAETGVFDLTLCLSGI